MAKERFPISSGQMELLLAFESAGSLEKLAATLARDPSVISRNLQKLAGDLPVLVKNQGRWRITPLGRQVNVLSRAFLTQMVQMEGVSSQASSAASHRDEMRILERSLLVIINAQKALHDADLKKRSNLDAEKNIRRLLTHWRAQGRPVVHVQHVSDRPDSRFYHKSPGADFMEGLAPVASREEPVFQKTKASAFSGTPLNKHIARIKAQGLVLAGFTAGECIDATARQASDLGFRTFVAGDATATFDLVGPDGRLHRAERLHRSTLATLHALFAKVLETEQLLK